MFIPNENLEKTYYLLLQKNVTIINCSNSRRLKKSGHMDAE